MSVALTGVAWMVAVVFGIAVTAHVRDPQRVRGVVEEIGLPGVTAEWALVVQVAAVALLVFSPQSGFLVAAGFLGAASGTFVVGMALGRSLSDCGCFALPHDVDGSFFMRNGLLGGIALAGWYWGPTGYPLLGLSIGAAAALVAVILATRQRLSVVADELGYSDPVDDQTDRGI